MTFHDQDNYWFMQIIYQFSFSNKTSQCVSLRASSRFTILVLANGPFPTINLKQGINRWDLMLPNFLTIFNDSHHGYIMQQLLVVHAIFFYIFSRSKSITTMYDQLKKNKLTRRVTAFIMKYIKLHTNFLELDSYNFEACMSSKSEWEK